MPAAAFRALVSKATAPTVASLERFISSRAVRINLWFAKQFMGLSVIFVATKLHNFYLSGNCFWSLSHHDYSHVNSVCRHSFLALRNITDYCTVCLLLNFKKKKYNAFRALLQCWVVKAISPLITQVLLHWLPDSERISFKILLLTYKAMNGYAPSYIEGSSWSW